MNIRAQYYVEVYGISGDDEPTNRYWFTEYSHALQSFVTTYSKRGKVDARPCATCVRIYLEPNDGKPSHQIGTITPLDKVFVYDAPEHF